MYFKEPLDQYIPNTIIYNLPTYSWSITNKNYVFNFNPYMYLK
jgi:hypothetical protein